MAAKGNEEIEAVTDDTTDCLEMRIESSDGNTQKGSTLAGHAIHLKYVPTFLGNIQEKNIIFCIDTSGSMYKMLEVIKAHLIEALLKMADDCEAKQKRFNIIEFSSEITQWSDKMVECTGETVALAKEWVGKLVPKTGTNTLQALITALSDDTCSAVYLITDGLPDQHPIDILEDVAYIGGNRPIHCYYVHDCTEDLAAVEFLKELAMESYGSLHIVSITNHGSIDKITPIYRAEATAEQIIRTTSGNVYPSNGKICSVGTSLNQSAFGQLQQGRSFATNDGSSHPWQMYPNLSQNSRSTYPNMNYGWSQFRPAKAWLKHAQDQIDSAGDVTLLNVPGPGSLLINAKILARCLDDGYFYLGIVKSQISQEKFLIAFTGKNGEYKETAYQETLLCDIISYEDAMRHAISIGDKVLAPFLKVADRYGPGVVLEGFEKRETGSGDDKALVVSLHNGQTVTVPFNTAVRIPDALHQRIAFEVKLPYEIRKKLSERDRYPVANGYPISGSLMKPTEYETYDPVWLSQPDPVVLRQYGAQSNGNPFHSGYPPYPAYCYPSLIPMPIFGKPGSDYAANGNDMEIAGYDRTKSELDAKVTSQIRRHKTSSEEKRQEREENVPMGRTNGNNGEKSVNFRDEGSDIEAEYASGDLQIQQDSGHGSSRMSGEFDITSDTEADGGNMDGGRRKKLWRRKRAKSAGGGLNDSRPAWKYWKHLEAPSLMEPMHYGPYRVGPYSESVPPVPWEARVPKTPQYESGGSYALGKQMNSMTLGNPSPTVRDSMGYYYPQPPNSINKPNKHGSGYPISDMFGRHQIYHDKHDVARMNMGRFTAEDRSRDWHSAMENQERWRQRVEEQNHQRVMEHIYRNREHQINQWETIERQQENKRTHDDLIRHRIEGRQQSDVDREQQRLDFLKKREENRRLTVERKEGEIVEIRKRREIIQRHKSCVRWNDVNDKLEAESAQQELRDARRRQATLLRLEHSRRVCDDELRRKEFSDMVANQQNAIFRAELLAK